MPSFYKFKPSNSTSFYNFDDVFVRADLFNPGDLLSWGLNQYGQLGIDNTDNKTSPFIVYHTYYDWKTVSAGSSMAAAIRYDGSLWTWGLNADGQLGNVSFISSDIPIQVGVTELKNLCMDVSCGYRHAAVVTSDGNLWMWGNNERYQLSSSVNTTPQTTNPFKVPVNSLNNITKKVSCGKDYTCIITENGELFSCGANEYGQIGNGSITDQSSFTTSSSYKWKSVCAGEFHTVGVTTERFLVSWGRNDYGQLGLNDTTNKLYPTKVGSDADWKQVSSNGLHTVAIKTNGTMWAWGSNYQGQLGVGSGISSTTLPIQVGTDINWKQVSCGRYNTVATKTDGSLWVWGLNDQNQLGLGGNFGNIVDTPTQIGSAYGWKLCSTSDSNFYAIRYQDVYPT